MAKFKLIFWEGKGSLVDANEPRQIIVDDSQITDSAALVMCRAASSAPLNGGWLLMPLPADAG